MSRTQPSDLAELLARQAELIRDMQTQIAMLVRRVADLEKGTR